MNDFSQSIAGRMGRKSNQVAKGISSSVTVDPLERLNQRMQGRTQGGAVQKKTKEGRARRSLLSSYGSM